MYCNRAIFLVFHVRPAMSHVCRARQCIKRSISPSNFLSTLDVMVTSFSNVNNFFFPVFKDKAQYNPHPLPLFFGRGSYQGIQYCHLSFANGVTVPNGCSRKPVSTFCFRRHVKFMLFYLVYGLVSVKRYVAALCLTCSEQKLLKLITGSFSLFSLFAKDRKQIHFGRRKGERGILVRFVLLLTNYCSRFLFEKPTAPHIIKQFPAFHGTRMFITVFTSARHLSLPQADHCSPRLPAILH
jgi:hypothetical protein